MTPSAMWVGSLELLWRTGVQQRNGTCKSHLRDETMTLKKFNLNWPIPLPDRAMPSRDRFDALPLPAPGISARSRAAVNLVFILVYKME